MNARKGLKRLGMRSYVVTGPLGAFIIEREYSPLRYFVRAAPILARTFAQQFKRLGIARAHAEFEAGLTDVPPAIEPRKPVPTPQPSVPERPARPAAMPLFAFSQRRRSRKPKSVKRSKKRKMKR